MGYSGYKTIFVGTDFPGATKNGFIAEHRYVAEQILGRRLKPGEVVHHKDQCRTNNDPSNILVFHTREDHARFHAGGTLELTEDGSYISRSFLQDIPCAYCGKIFSPSNSHAKYCCLTCSNLAARKVSRPNRNQLRRLILEFNFEQIGEIYGVSSNTIREWCKSYKLPARLKDVKKMRLCEKEKVREEKWLKEKEKRIHLRDEIVEKISNENFK